MAIAPRPITVLHVISSLGVLGGGAQRQLLLYFQHRSPQWRHIVAYQHPRALLRDDVERTGVPTVWLGRGGLLPQLARLARLARVWSADVIHTHLYEANLLGRVAGRLLGVPVVTSLVSTLDIEERVASGTYRQPWKYRLSLGLEALTGRWGTARFIAISEAVRDSAMRAMRIPSSRFRVVYRAVQADPPVGLRPAGSGPTLICVGRLIPSKGQDFLIRMLPAVAARWPTVRLQLVGPGPEQARLEALAARCGVTGHVEFLGLRSDVSRLLQQADLFVYASWFEGFTLVIAEATAAGLPVVSVDLPVSRETATPASVIFVERDEQAFAQAVLHVLDRREAFHRAAREESALIRERFSVERYVQGIESVYAEAKQLAAGPAAEASAADGEIQATPMHPPVREQAGVRDPGR